MRAALIPTWLQEFEKEAGYTVSMEKVITDDSSERITIKWDGERFAIVQQKKASKRILAPCAVVILSPGEMLELIQFAGNLGGK